MKDLVAYKKYAATLENLKLLVNHKMRVIHISCHGIWIKAKNGIDYVDYLVFEKENGREHLIEKKELKDLISKWGSSKP